MQVDRRSLLTGASAALAASALPAPARAARAPFERKIGAAAVSVISDGSLSVSLSFTLPETPPQEVAALLSTLGMSSGDVPVPTNVTWLRTENEVVLADCGAGANFQPTAGKLFENMEAAGLDPAQVTKIVFTHGHADHLWGAIDEFDELRFPNASYVISAAEWNFWTDPNTPARVPDWLAGMAHGSARILKRLESKIERKKPGDVVAAGLTYVATPGHTPGHMSLLLESAGEQLLIGGDALTHSGVSFARPEWRIGSDFDRDLAVNTRRRLLDRLATDRLEFIGFHLPWPGHGTVERRDTSFRFVPTT